MTLLGAVLWIMKLTIKQNEFEHIPEESSYNNNYYRHKENGVILFEECHEDYDYQSFYFLENGQKIFLGDSQDGFSINDEYIVIEFKKEFT